MPTTITRIQKTRLGRFSLYGEEGFLFSLDSETYFSCGVEEGDTLTDGDLTICGKRATPARPRTRPFSTSRSGCTASGSCTTSCA